MTILWLVLAESIAITLIGSILGIGIAAFGLLYIDELMPVTSQIGALGVSIDVFLQGLGIAILTGVLVGLPPAIQAKRINIIDALRSN